MSFPNYILKILYPYPWNFNNFHFIRIRISTVLYFKHCSLSFVCYATPNCHFPKHMWFSAWYALQISHPLPDQKVFVCLWKLLPILRLNSLKIYIGFIIDHFYNARGIFLITYNYNFVPCWYYIHYNFYRWRWRWTGDGDGLWTSRVRGQVLIKISKIFWSDLMVEVWKKTYFEFVLY